MHGCDRRQDKSSGFPVERRRRSRGDVDPLDWETKVLRRLECRVEALSNDAVPGAQQGSGFGWEETPLRTLLCRVRTSRG